MTDVPSNTLRQIFSEAVTFTMAMIRQLEIHAESESSSDAVRVLARDNEAVITLLRGIEDKLEAAFHSGPSGTGWFVLTTGLNTVNAMVETAKPHMNASLLRRHYRESITQVQATTDRHVVDNDIRRRVLSEARAKTLLGLAP